jgi:hypothetical protein
LSSPSTFSSASPSAACRASRRPGCDGAPQPFTVFATTAIGVALGTGPLRERIERVLDLVRRVPVDRPHLEPRTPRASTREPLGALLIAHAPRLPVLVAVEDRQHVRQLVVDDEVERLGDLPLARLTVADDAVDPLVEPVHPRRLPEARRDAQP